MDLKSKTRPILTVVLGLAAGACGSSSLADTSPPPAQNQNLSAQAPSDEIATLRAKGPAGLAEVLDRFDAAKDEATKAELGLLVDRVAAQRYATVSRLFWQTDIDKAIAAAKKENKPILSLRMLGRLDTDMSCANSRLFRVVLYANREVSKYLRDNFILHWSSERDVPRVVVEFGDGRKLETTIAGNSAHYVLDTQGRPVDVLPGLYSPEVFIESLDQAIVLARETRNMEDRERRTALAQYHARVIGEINKRYGTNTTMLVSGRIYQGGQAGSIAIAEQRTMGKAAIEVPMVETIELGAPLVRLQNADRIRNDLALRIKKPVKLDAQSHALVSQLSPTDWKKSPKPLDDKALANLVRVLEYNVAADTVLNELGLRRQIQVLFQNLSFDLSFENLNKHIYANIFQTPADDPWLGMATPGVFTGIPGDGLAAN